jgi:hypothetical protein
MPHVIPREAPHSDDTAAPEVETETTYDSEEFLEAYPEWRATYDKVEKGYVAFVSEVEGVYVRLQQITDRGEFAREVKKYFFAGIVLAWKNEEEDRRRRRQQQHSKKTNTSRSDKPTTETAESEVDEDDETKENERWQGIDGWTYYGGWGLKRLIKDMRELEETGSHAKAKGAPRRNLGGGQP